MKKILISIFFIFLAYFYIIAALYDGNRYITTNSIIFDVSKDARFFHDKKENIVLPTVIGTYSLAGNKVAIIQRPNYKKIQPLMFAFDWDESNEGKVIRDYVNSDKKKLKSYTLPIAIWIYTEIPIVKLEGPFSVAEFEKKTKLKFIDLKLDNKF